MLDSSELDRLRLVALSLTEGQARRLLMRPKDDLEAHAAALLDELMRYRLRLEKRPPHSPRLE